MSGQMPLAPYRHDCSLVRVLLCLLALLAINPAHAASALAEDSFDTLAPWRADAADGVQAALSAVQDNANPALRLNYDFAGAGGYAFARRDWPAVLPENFEIEFRIRGSGARNHLEIKLVDASGDNVWWYPQRNVVFDASWRTVRIKRRQFAFAWGPTGDQTLREFQRIEFVVAAGADGGKGHIDIDDLRLRQIPVVRATHPQPRAFANRTEADGAASSAVDGDAGTAWRSTRGASPATLNVDLGEVREFGALALNWLPGAHASRYDVELSLDGGDWRRVRRVIDGNGGSDALQLTESEARYLRLTLFDGPAPVYGLAELTLRDIAVGESANAFVEALAREAPRGSYPRGFSGEATQWTLLGTPDGGDTGLISADGAIEAAPAAFAVEPFLEVAGQLVSWADVTVRQSLLNGYLPLPSVHWASPTLALTISAVATRERNARLHWIRYRVTNTTRAAARARLLLAARPFQAYPPVQFLNTHGGVSPINVLRWDGRVLTVNDRYGVAAYSPPGFADLGSYDAREAMVHPVGLLGPSTAVDRVDDATGLASATLAYPLVLAPGGSQDVVVALGDADVVARLPRTDDPAATFESVQRQAAAQWQHTLDRVQFDLPAAAQPVADAIRASLAYLLTMRQGPALQPGTRSYDRSWIRDGAMIGEGLLRLGEYTAVRDYLHWYAGHQYANGKVPCCVDRRGADPVAENDSQGELIYLAAEYWRRTHDLATLKKLWPHIAGAVRYMESLRQSTRQGTPATDAERALFGLMPASISHEGYSAKPMHSYWDDFWALRGYKDAVAVAEALGMADEAARWRGMRDEFSADLHASLAVARRVHGIDYLPGCAELGDFDASSTTIALAPAGETERLPPDALNATFERYWREFVARRDNTREWKDYAPYEWRIVSAMLRLGWRERAQAVFDYLFADRQPAAWQQWPEVVGHDKQLPRFIGDLPHGWVASDFVRAALDGFAYERDDGAIVLAAGLPLTWLDGRGVGIRKLGTRHGPLAYRLARSASLWTLTLDGAARPPGGFRFDWPLPGELPLARIDGRAAEWQGRTLFIPAAAKTIVMGGK